jgi:predicted transcriptional regulator
VKSTEQSKAEVGQTLILTLLSQSSGPINGKDLATLAELSPDWYDEIIRALKNEELIEESNSKFTLTQRGWEAAKRARGRLLSPW